MWDAIVVEAIPEIGAEPGDLLFVREGHPTHQVLNQRVEFSTDRQGTVLESAPPCGCRGFRRRLTTPTASIELDVRPLYRGPHWNAQPMMAT